jgi:prepilin-type processing-associated H-X9-DG protein
VLAGDANLVQHGRVVPSGVVNLATNITTWTRDRHGRTGNILLADGSVRFESTTEISSSVAPGAYASTNRVVVP